MRLPAKQYAVYCLINAYLIIVRHTSVIVPKVTAFISPDEAYTVCFCPVYTRIRPITIYQKLVLHILSTLFIPSLALKSDPVKGKGILQQFMLQ
jgi:hypothetical protein